MVVVSESTYERLKRIRDKLGLRSVELVITLMLDLYESSLTNMSEVMISLLLSTKRIEERLEDMSAKLSSLQVSSVSSPEENVQTAVSTIGDLPDFVQGNPWLSVISKRSKET